MEQDPDMTPAEPARRILVALDTAEVAAACALAERLNGAVGGVKLGLEFFTANGSPGVEAVAATGQPIFLDLKFHDIPTTVAGAVGAALALKPFMLTVHAAGGPAMLRAAMDAVGGPGSGGGPTGGDGRPLVVAVTVLTSLGEDDLRLIGQDGPVIEQAGRLADLARGAGIDGVVCSPREVAALRARCGPDFKLVVAGVRPAWAGADDQKRFATPAEAVAEGADFLVIGRPITGAPDPVDAARRIAAEVAEAGG